MQKITYIDSPEIFLNTVSKKIKQTDIVLDIGCGINPQKYIKPVVHICAEPYEQYAQHLLQKIGNKEKFFIVLKQKWDEVIKTIPKNGVDTIITLDVIEHLEKEEGLEVLKNTIPLARKQVVIFTPYGFLPQEVPEGMKDAWGLDGSEWQKHKSGWTEKDFDENWDIYICPEFHFYDAITNEKFEKPYGAMFAILNKNEYSKYNIYSFTRNIYGFLTHTLPLYFRTNNIFYNPVLKFIYRKIILKIIKK
ncbi:MAG: class I SAM-dependent methyltransferase [Candidatus Gracilibacteria bacterium]|nr:class I SAM-dependent methyltransferase [Candidatus Gracilibacteria bacterium]